MPKKSSIGCENRPPPTLVAWTFLFQEELRKLVVRHSRECASSPICDQRHNLDMKLNSRLPFFSSSSLARSTSIFKSGSEKEKQRRRRSEMKYDVDVHPRIFPFFCLPATTECGITTGSSFSPAHPIGFHSLNWLLLSSISNITNVAHRTRRII